MIEALIEFPGVYIGIPAALLIWWIGRQPLESATRVDRKHLIVVK